MKIRYLLSVACLLALVLTAACSSQPYTPPVECEEGQSIILERIDDPAALSKGLLAVNLAALEAVDGYGPEEAGRVLDHIDDLIDGDGLTYADVTAYVLRKIEVANALAGAAVFIAGDDIGALDVPLQVSACDAALIRKHLVKQRRLMAVYTAGKGG